MTNAALAPQDSLTPEQQRALNVYAELMAEARTRTSSIPQFVEARTEIPDILRLEACVLQLRIVCELIALGCLVAHGDIEEVRNSRLQKAYEADFIVNSLERLHPDFYPIPHVVEGDASEVEGGKFFRYTAKTQEFLTKDALVKLYRRAGSILHRGSLKSLFLDTTSDEDLLKEIHAAHTQMVELLASHHLMTRDREFAIVCAVSEDGGVHVALAGRMPFGGCSCSELLIAQT